MSIDGRLAGRRAIVVGGGQRDGATLGNGRAIALAFAHEGAHVLVADRDAEAAASTVELIRDAGGRAEAHKMDVTSEQDCQQLPDAAQSAIGGVDVLANNVGVVLDDLTLEEWNRTLEVNLTGMWLTCKYVVPVMVAQKRGVIVNTSSTASLTPAAPGPIGYAAAKVGVDMLTRTLALRHARDGLRVNAVAPGMIDTPLGVDRVAKRRGIDRAEVARERALPVPMGVQGSAWDVANAAVFFASEESAYVTGVVMPVDGGITLTSQTWDMTPPPGSPAAE